jgi:GTPase SAR1 family protein
VVVCGEFKRGKSSLLNALLEEPDLFPVDSFYATGLITTAGFGAEENISVTVTAPDGYPRQLEIKRDEIAAYATESANPDNAKQVQLLTIHTPNPRLAQGLSVVDTPGVGGVYERHSALTLGFLQNASALIFVTDVTQPLLESELDFLRRAAETARVTGDADGLIFVLTKVDAVPDFERILANTKAKLADVTGRRAETIEVVPVSARAKLDYLKNGSPEYLEMSNFDALEQVLWAALARRRAKALLGTALDDLDRAACALLAPIDTAMRVVSGEDRELTGISVQNEDRAAWLAELRDSKNRWRSDLDDQLSQALGQLQERGQQELEELWQKCETSYLHDDRYLAAPDLVLKQVIDDAAAAFGAISELAGRVASRALQDFSARHGLELRRPEFGDLPVPAIPLLRVSAEIPKADRQASGLLRWTRAESGSKSAGTAGAGVGMAVGAVVGSVVPGVGTVVGMNVGWIAGFVLGSGVGTVSGYRDAVKETQSKGVVMRREQLWAELQPLHVSQRRHLAEGLEDLMGDYRIAAIRELDSRIVQEQESVAEALARLKALRDQAEHAAESRRAQLAAERAPLDRMHDRIGRLATAAVALDGTGSADPDDAR